MIRRIAFFLCLLPLYLSSTEYRPWYDYTLVGEFRNTHRVYLYDKVESPTGDLPYDANAYFTTVSLGINPVDVFTGSYSDNWYAEAEATLARTPRRTWGFDNIKLTVRYMVLEDIVGDPVSLTIGATMIQAFRLALTDISSFHHGLYEGEFHITAGKEWSSGSRWIHRVWTMALIGFAEQGSPWLRTRLAYDYNYCERYLFQLFVEALYGLGKENLDLWKKFRGYGSIRHQSIDVGSIVRYQMDSGILLSLEASQRIHQKNFPDKAKIYQLQLFVPFSL